MRLLGLPHELLLYLVYFLGGDDFYRLIKTCKLLRMEFKTLAERSSKDTNLNIFLQVDTNNLFYRKYAFMLSRNWNTLHSNITDYIRTYNGRDIDQYGRKWSLTSINYDNTIRNVRIFKNNVFFTKIVKDDYIKINGGAFITDEIYKLLHNIPLEPPKQLVLKNVYYILYNSNMRPDNCSKVGSGSVTYNYLYNEWDFNGIYICENTEQILESVSVILKRGISNIYKWLETNHCDSIERYVSELLKYTNSSTLKFVKQLRYARVYCDRIYMINIINRWKTIYEYGNNLYDMRDESKRLIECLPSGEERYIKSHPVLNIPGIYTSKRDTTTRITEYFF